MADHPKSLAALKRVLHKGSRLLCVKHDFDPVLAGRTYFVTHVQSNGFWAFCEQDAGSREGWRAYAPAKLWTFNENGEFTYAITNAWGKVGNPPYQYATYRLLPRE